jgi:hypothetical protein
MLKRFEQGSTGEVEAILKKGNATIEEILRAPNLVQQFRAENEMLMERIAHREGLLEILGVVRSSKDRGLQKLILSLFQTPNTCLHHLFARDLALTDAAIAVLDDDTPTSRYAIGIISQLLSRAVDLWADELTDVFRLSKKIPVVVIRHLNEAVVLQFVSDLTTDSHHRIPTLTWHCFRALPHSLDVPKRRRPRAVYSELDCEESFDLTPAHIANISTLLKNHFEFVKGKDKEFEELVIEYIEELPDDAVIPQLYELARTLRPSNRIGGRAYRTCLAGSVTPELFEAALAYLSTSATLFPLLCFEALLLKLLRDLRTSNLVMAQWLIIVQMLAKAPDTKAQLANDMQSMLSYVWTEFEGDEAPEVKMKRSFIMTAAGLIEDPSAPLAKWPGFREWATKWSHPEANTDWSENPPFDGNIYDFEGQWDEDLIQRVSAEASRR